MSNLLCGANQVFVRVLMWHLSDVINPYLCKCLILYIIHSFPLFYILFTLLHYLIDCEFCVNNWFSCLFSFSLYFRPLFNPKWNCMFGYSENVSVLWIYFAVTHLLRWQIWIECLSLEWSSMKHKIDFFSVLLEWEYISLNGNKKTENVCSSLSPSLFASLIGQMLLNVPYSSWYIIRVLYTQLYLCVSPLLVVRMDRPSCPNQIHTVFGSGHSFCDPRSPRTMSYDRQW